jgi:cellobiose phosphorylase
MIYKFIDDKGTFIVKDPQKYNLYFPLTNQDGGILSSISPNLAGDIKKDNDHFLTPPASIEDLRSNLLCRREFFIKIDKETIRLSYPYDDTLEAGFLYQKLIKKTASLQIEILNFIPYNLAVEVMWVKVINMGNKKINLVPTSFIPLYGRSEKNLRDHRHVCSLLNRIYLDRYGILLRPTMVFDEKGHKINKTIYFVLGYEGQMQPPLGQFPTLDYFYGAADLTNPDAIVKDIRPVHKKLPKFNGKEVAAAFRFKPRQLNKGQEINYYLIMGVDEDRQRIKNTFHRLNSPQKINQSLQETKKYWQDYLLKVNFDFKDRNFNNWLLWVKLQPLLRKLFGCSFLPHFDYGKGGRGWRDLWQDALALLITEPEKARDIILNNFKGARIDGSNATIITKEGDFISDRNRISRVWMDHGIWPYLALRLYLDRTADLNILFKETAYFRDHQLNRAAKIDSGFMQKDYFLRSRRNRIYKGSILEHVLVQNLIAFFNVGMHNIIRLENADWNDGLDMAVENGESVAFSFMYAHNLIDICSVLEKLKEKKESIIILKELFFLLDRINKPINYLNYKEKQARLDAYFEKTENISGQKTKVKIGDLIRDLKEKSEHLFTWLRSREWIGNLGFFNGYYDNEGRRVEGKAGDNIRMMLPSQVFAIMSGVAGDEQVKKVWVCIKRYLKDKRLGGFRLNTDFKYLYPHLGRAFGFSYGDKENGAFFNHMAIMLAHALYKRNFRKEGGEVLESIYKMATANQAKIYPMIPEYFNNEGEALYYYLTGSASWYIYTLLQEVLGVNFFWGDIIFNPRLTRDDFFNRTIEIKFPWQDKIIKTIFRKISKKQIYRIKEVLLEGKKIMPANYGCLIKGQWLKEITKQEIAIEIYLA